MENKDLKRLYKNSDLSWSGAFYSIQRIDLLIISISGAGIYTCFEILKYVRQEHLGTNLCFLKLTGILFTSAIILNFISQFTAYKGNFNSFLKADKEIDQIENSTNNEIEINNLTGYISVYDKITNIINIISALIMIISLICLTIFISALL